MSSPNITININVHDHTLVVAVGDFLIHQQVTLPEFPRVNILNASALLSQDKASWCPKNALDSRKSFPSDHETETHQVVSHATLTEQSTSRPSPLLSIFKDYHDRLAQTTIPITGGFPSLENLPDTTSPA